MGQLLACSLTAAIGLLVCWSAIYLILRKERRTRGAPERGDMHHTHRKPVSRLGGVALAASFLVVTVLAFARGNEGLAPDQHPAAFVALALGMFLVGLWDDIRPLGARKKLLSQVIVAILASCAGFSISVVGLPFTRESLDLGWWSLPVTVLWLVSMTNLINLVDGLDGLAGGISLMLMILLVYVGLAGQQLVVVAAGMAGALMGFLWFNFPPARIYMGDGGAYFLGFLVGLMAIVNSNKGTVLAALTAPLFVLALPILDTSLAILRRGTQGLPVFRPDRKHLHHRLLSMGFSRRRIVLGFYLLTLLFLVMAFLAFSTRGQLVPLLLGVLVLVILVTAGQLDFSREWFAVGRVLGSSIEMRKDVQYALALSKWLEMEAERASSPDALFEDFAFMAQKLGFTHLRLRHHNLVRTWSNTPGVAPVKEWHHALGPGERDSVSLGITQEGSSSDKTLEVLGELAAEAWFKAARRLEKTRNCTVFPSSLSLS